MGKTDVSALAVQMIEAVRGFVAKSEAAINVRLDAIEAKIKAIPPGVKGDKGDPGKDGAPGKPGESIKGEKGEPGKDGASVHPDTIALMIRDAADKVAASMPKPKDGRDGFSLEDFDMAMSEDGRTLSLKFVRGEAKIERQIKLATMIYREVWRAGEYERGDVVTWGGSAWHCKDCTTSEPGTSDDWKMMVKKGAAGRDFDDPKARSNREVVRLK